MLDKVNNNKLYKNITYVVMCASMAMAGVCSADSESVPTTAANYTQATVEGFHNIRYWGDKAPPHKEDILDHYRSSLKINPTLLDRFDLLALSGGADDGAYGAGFLKGWSESGERPNFDLVTGVSTGALIAPFAFLGKDYDDNIKRFYTEVTADDIFSLKLFTAISGGSSLADTTPLRNIIRKEVNDELVGKIAKEFGKGRVLLIGTTNLNAQRQMVWDVTRIAASGNPAATELIGDILLASASIPGAFPPVKIDVSIDGEQYHELYVDGGVTYEIFGNPPSVNIMNVIKKVESPSKDHNFWLIRNTKIDSEFENTGTSMLDIVTRSINTLIKYQGRGDLIALAGRAKRAGYKFNLTYVPQDFSFKSDGMFDPKYMKALYDIGYSSGLKQDSWKHDLHKILRQKE